MAETGDSVVDEIEILLKIADAFVATVERLSRARIHVRPRQVRPW